MAESFKVSIKGDLNDLESKITDGRRKLNAFKLKAATEGKVKITVNIAQLQKDLADARQRLRKFRAEGNKEAEIKTRVEIGDLQEKIRTSRKALRDLEGSVNQTGKSFFSLNGIVKDAIKAFAGFEIVRRTFGLFKSAFDAAVSFESAFAGVKKTVEATVPEFEALSQGFRDLAKEIPISVEQLARIGELGGQLGVAKEDLIDFTETIAKIAVTTNLTEEEASTAFARIANVMQRPISEVDQMASSVVELGNNFATTEAEIVNFANRISSTGAVVGLTSSDIFAIGTAFSSVGIEAEAGGTAVQKALLEINDAVNVGGAELERFAQVSGTSATDFAALWKSDPARAFDLFVKGLGSSGDDASAILEELVAGDVRLERAFLALASSGDILTKALDTSNQAFAENTALTEEAEKRFETAESKLQAYKNTWNDIAITVGNFLKVAVVPVLGFLTDLAEDLVHGTENLGLLTLAIKSAGIAFGAFFSLSVLGGITRALGTLFDALKNGQKTLAGMRTSILALQAANKAAAVSTAATGAAIQGTGAAAVASSRSVGLLAGSLALLTNPLFLVGIAAGGLAFHFFNTKKKAAELDRTVAELSETLSGIGAQTTGAQLIAADLESATQRVIDKQRELNQVRAEASIGQSSFEEFKALADDQETRVKNLRKTWEEYFIQMGANEEQLALFREELSIFNDAIPDVAADMELLADKASDVGAAYGQMTQVIDETQKRFNKTVDVLVRGGSKMGDAITTVKESMSKDFEAIGEDGEELIKDLVLNLVKGVAESGKLGEAFTLALAQNMTRGDVIASLEAASIRVNETTLTPLIQAAIQAGDEGELLGLLWAAGVEEKSLESRKAGESLANFAIRVLDESAVDANNFGQKLGSSAVGGIIQGIKDKFPSLASAFNSILNLLGSGGGLKGLGPALDAIIPGAGKVASVFGSISNEAAKIRDNLIAAEKVINDVDSGNTGKKTGGGGGGKNPAEEAMKEAEKAAKDAESAVKKYNDEVERTAEESRKLKEKVRAFYGDIVEDIEKAKEAQDRLNEGLADFKQEATADFVGDAAGRAFELDEDAKNLKEEIADLQAEEEQDLERITKLKEDLRDIEAERAKISGFIETLKPLEGAEGDIIDLAKLFEEEFKNAGLSDFEQAKIAFDKKIALKEEEVQAEIDKQQRIIDIQNRFLELQTATDEESIKARERLNAIAGGEEVLTAEQRKAALQELGFEELSIAEQLALLKQAQQANALEAERQAVLDKEEELLEAKKEFLNLAEEAHTESVNNMLAKTDELIARIKAAQIEQQKLNALQRAGGGGGGNVNNFNIEQNIGSDVDFEAANQKFFDKANSQ